MVDMSKYMEDAERIAETIFQLDYKREIKNRESFDYALDNYLDNAFQLRENDEFRNMVFGKFVETYPSTITDEDNFFRDRERRTIPQKKIKREYSFLGKVENKIVYLRKGYINMPNGRKREVFRDRGGKFGQPKNR